MRPNKISWKRSIVLASFMKAVQMMRAPMECHRIRLKRSNGIAVPHARVIVRLQTVRTCWDVANLSNARGTRGASRGISRGNGEVRSGNMQAGRPLDVLSPQAPMLPNRAAVPRQQ